jgi:hypothetical protein
MKHAFILVTAALTLSTLIQLSTSSQNQAPRFYPPLQPNYFFPEYNVTKPGDVLLWLNATDPDDTDLRFGVEGDFYRKFLSITKVEGSKRAVVRARQPFDREAQEKFENIVFYVQDKPGNKVYQSVRFVVLDIDDNPPLFKNTPYVVSISENQSVNSIVLEAIEAQDLDGPLYNKFTFELVNSDGGLFAIGKTSFVASGRYSTSLFLKQRLDYERSRTHILTLQASGENSQFKSTTELLVNVIDYPNKPPEFAQSPYYVRIDEELDVDAPVLTVAAKDGDTGINNPCSFKILAADESTATANSQPDYFRIEPLTGVVRVHKRIDLEAEEIGRLGGLLEFWVLAAEVGDERSTQRVKVIVKINDVNDNEPVFNRDVFSFVVSPRAPAGTSLSLVDADVDSLHVNDTDKGVNGSFSLMLFRVVKHGENVAAAAAVAAAGATFLYDDYADFEVVPKVALNEANVIVKVKNSTNLLSRMGSIEQYHVTFFFD